MSDRQTTRATPRAHATMKQVAALAGVGTKTVSRVINNEPNVAVATAERVWKAITQLDYYVDEGAGNLRRDGGRTKTLGLLVGSVDNPFSGAVHRAVEDVAKTHAMAVFASSLDDDPSNEKGAITAFLRRRVEGLIVTMASHDHSYLISAIERGTPVVFIDRAPSGIDVDAVVSDNREGTARATRHLLDHGHRHIAFLGDRLSLHTAAERLRGFQDEIARAGIPSHQAPTITDLHTAASAERALGSLLDADPEITAVVSAQNLITIGALHALRARGVQHQIALVGFDDLPLADLVDPGVTVIAQHPSAIGRRAAEKLFSRLAGDNSPAERIIVPTSLIARGSGEITPTVRRA